jgi:hypothetical protein
MVLSVPIPDGDCGSCSHTTPCFCRPEARNHPAPVASTERCADCNTSIAEYGDGVGWRHLEPYSSHRGCTTATPYDDPLVLGEVPPLVPGWPYLTGGGEA